MPFENGYWGSTGGGGDAPATIFTSTTAELAASGGADTQDFELEIGQAFGLVTHARLERLDGTTSSSCWIGIYDRDPTDGAAKLCGSIYGGLNFGFPVAYSIAADDTAGLQQTVGGSTGQAFAVPVRSAAATSVWLRVSNEDFMNTLKARVTVHIAPVSAS